MALVSGRRLTGTSLLAPVSFGSFNLQAGNYRTLFLQDAVADATPEARAILAATTQGFPVDVGFRPHERALALHMMIQCQDRTAEAVQADVNALYLAFDVLAADQQYLVVRAGDGTRRRLPCRCEQVLPVRFLPGVYVLRLLSASALWEDVDEDEDGQLCDETPEVWQIVVPGTTRCFPTLEVKPIIAASHALKYLRRQYINIVSRTSEPMFSTNGLPYPIEFLEGAIDLSALNGAGQLQADGDDFRIYVDGVEFHRTIKTDLTADYCWGGVSWAPMRLILTHAAMTAASPGMGEWLDIDDDEGTFGWGDTGFFMAGDEVVQYDARELTRLRIKQRAARDTTAAVHAIDVPLYWAEHEIFALYDNEAAVDPSDSVDQQVVPDVATSSNLVHKYPSLWTAPGTLRPGQFLRRYRADNIFSAAISYLEDGTDARFRDIVPTAAALRFNEFELATPCGVKAAAGAITHDVTVPPSLSLRVFGVDMEGLETLLQTYHQNNDGVAVTLQPASVLSRLRWNTNIIVLTGMRVLDDADVSVDTIGVFQNANQRFVLDQEAVITGFVVRLARNAAADGTLQLVLMRDDSGAPGGTTVTATYSRAVNTLPILPAAYADQVELFDESVGTRRYLRLAAGTYWVYVGRGGETAGIVYWSTAGMSGVYPHDGLFLEDDPGPGYTRDGRPGRFLILGEASGPLQAEAPSGSGDEGILDDIEITFDNATPRTPDVYVSPQNIVYHLTGTLRNDDTEQEITMDQVLPLYFPEYDESHVDGNFTFGSGASHDRAQGIKVPVDTTLAFVRLWLKKVGNPTDNLIVRIETDDGTGVPSQTVIPNGTSEPVDGSTLGAGYAWITFTFSIPPTLLAGVQYHICIDRTGPNDAVDYYHWGAKTSAGTYYDGEPSLWTAGGWINQSGDCAFQMGTAMLVIDCEAHTVIRTDTGENVPGAIAPSDRGEWMRADPGTVVLRHTEVGVGEVLVTAKRRGRWA